MNSALSISKGLTFALVSATLIFGMGACEKDPVKSMPGPGEYLNSKVGSNWSYSTTGTSSSDWTVKVEDSTALYLSNTFQMYKTNTAGVISRNYYRYSKGNYSVLVLDADGATQEIVYLKDSTQTGKNGRSRLRDWAEFLSNTTMRSSKRDLKLLEVNRLKMLFIFV